MSLFDKRLLPLAFGALALVSLTAHAQTQAAMNQDACAQYKKADQALNATYAKVLKRLCKRSTVPNQTETGAAGLDRFSRCASRRAFSESRQADRVRIRLSHLPLRPPRGTHGTTRERVESLGRRHSGRGRLQWKREERADRGQGMHADAKGTSSASSRKLDNCLFTRVGRFSA